jgi:aminopeptidase YwaD
MRKRMLLLATVILMTVSLTAQFTSSPEQLEAHVNILASDALLGRGFGTPQGLKAAQYIAEQFEEAGIESYDGAYLHPFMHRTGILNIPGNNVIGVVWGSDPELKDEFIVLGAHYDHLGWKIVAGDTVVYNGADDNATGSSSIIEIGRNLVVNKASLGRSVILVAFDGEESGLIGSKHFLGDSMLPPHQIKLMFSLDMVGMVRAHKGLDMKGISLLDDADYLVGELAGKYSLNITKANKEIEQRTDTAPFGRMGIPAVAPTSGTESPYHKPADTAEKLDYEGMARVAGYMTDATLYLSTRPSLSDMSGVADGETSVPHTKLFRAGLRLNMGSSQHNYGDQYYKGKDIFATGIGLLTNFRLSGNFHLQAEALYETKGSEHSDGIFRTHSLTTPLNLLLMTDEDEFVRFYGQVGGYYSYHFGGSISGTPIDFDNDFNKQEFGLTFGIGLEGMGLQMGVIFQRGLSDLNRLTGDHISHQNIYFTLGYLF